MKEKRKEKVGGGVVRDTTVLEGGQSKQKCWVLKVPRQCPLGLGRGKACIRDFFNFDF
jgi:hypothetical protein